MSEAAKAVAREVLENIGQGKIPSIKEIGPRHGYSKSTAKAGLIQKTKSYQSVIQPVVEKMKEEREAILVEMKLKRSKANYKMLVDGLEATSKYIQLLSGGNTESIHLDEDRRIVQMILAEIRHEPGAEEKG